MKIIPCPIHGPRNITEFVCKGTVQKMPSMQGEFSATTKGSSKTAAKIAAKIATKIAWANYLFLNENPAAIIDEWWLHTPSGLWFVARRDTRTDQILQTWLMHDYARAKKTARK